MQRLENANYAFAKQACYICGQPHDVVDTEAFVEGEGALCICRGCVADMAQTAGFILESRSAQIADLEERLVDANKRANLAEEEVVQMGRRAQEIKEGRMERMRKAKSDKAKSIIDEAAVSA